MQRRAFLGVLGGLTLVSGAGSLSSLSKFISADSQVAFGKVDLAADSVSQGIGPRLASAARSADGSFQLIVTQGDKVVSSNAIGLRGHGVVAHPKQHAVLVMARRPGNLMYLIDQNSGEVLKTITAAPTHHFYGHGVFSKDGNTYWSTENNVDTGEGLIVCRDSTTFDTLIQFPSYGIGPHQLEFLNHQSVLVVANGGILTRPDQPRKKLNLDTMEPNLSYIDIATGKLLAQYKPEFHQQSLRHLTVSPKDQVAVGIQYEGDPTRVVPLVVFHSGEDQLLNGIVNDESEWQRFNQYTASLACSDEKLCVTSPRGGVVSFWDMQTRKLTQFSEFKDCAGAGWHTKNQSFVVSSGEGFVRWYDQASLKVSNEHHFKGIQWDNHLGLIS